MSDQTLPDPLVPADVDLRGLEYMPLLGGKLFASDFDLDANDAEFRIGLRLWWAAWNQVPAGSLPAEDHRQCKLAGLDENRAKWRKVRDRALHGFELCSDGRLYHPVIAAQAIIAWEKRAEDRDERENEAERQRRVRAERKVLFAQLREVGIRPKYDTPMGTLRELVTQHVTVSVTPPVTVTEPAPVTRTVTQTDTAKTGRDGTGRDNTFDEGEESTSTVVTPAAQVCRALRQAGMPSVQSQHPTLLALLEAGATAQEFLDAMPAASGKRDPFTYLLTVVQRRREDAKASAGSLHQGPMPGTPEAMPWHATSGGIKAKGAELGIPYDRADECKPFDAYKARVLRAAQEHAT